MAGWLKIQTTNQRGFWCWRLYVGPLYRRCAIDLTVTHLFSAGPVYRRLRLFGWTVYERNRAYSGHAA